MDYDHLHPAGQASCKGNPSCTSSRTSNRHGLTTSFQKFAAEKLLEVFFGDVGVALINAIHQVGSHCGVEQHWLLAHKADPCSCSTEHLSTEDVFAVMIVK